MRSAASGPGSGNHDLSALARIRYAAFELFAEHGFARTTVRAIAERAGVSPALILHHYGSKDGLRTACDAHLLDRVRSEKMLAFTSGFSTSAGDYLAANPEMRVYLAYLARVLAEGGPAASSVFDRMTDDVRDYLAAGEAAGTVRPTGDPEARAALHAAIGAGLLMVAPVFARRLGGDDLLDAGVLARYTRVVYELYGHGLLTGPLADAVDAEISRGDIPPQEPTQEER